MVVFDFVDNIIKGKPFKEEKDFSKYVPFLVNRALSNFWDTCLIANELNMIKDMPVEAQYAFLDAIVTKKNRWSKWSKAKKLSSKVKVIQDYYGYSDQKAQEAYDLMPADEYRKFVKSLPEKGGIE